LETCRKNGNWQYCSDEEIEAILTVKDIQGIIKELKCIRPNQAMTMLGVNLAPNGNMDQQAVKMRSLSMLWADQTRTEKLSCTEYWTAFHSTLWRTLAYPLPALNLTKTQCAEIMLPELNQFLPRCLVFAPLGFGGLSIPNLYTTQEILRITNTIEHIANWMDTGK
jgi:hypothetical protein